MLQFVQPVKFLGVETKSGTAKSGKPYNLTEMKLFIPDLGRVKVQVIGSPRLPDIDTFVNLKLSVDQGSFQSLRVVFDESSQFAPVK